MSEQSKQPGQVQQAGGSTVRRGSCTSEWKLSVLGIAIIVILLVMSGMSGKDGQPILNTPEWVTGVLWAMMLGALGVIIGTYNVSRGMVKAGQSDVQFGIDPGPDAVSVAEVKGVDALDRVVGGGSHGDAG